MALTSGTKLGPYEIQSPLGVGGMGEVYRALDSRLDRAVAVKILASHLSSSPELKQRMEREARAISSLNHPNICHLYDIGSQDGADYLVMELLEGETLAERLRKGAMPLNEIYRVGIAVAEALAFAHRNGIVHRDLKPGNIMLTPSGAKLMDFGLAKPLGLQNAASVSVSAPAFTAMQTISGPSPLSPLTTAGSIVGTIQYMSPEQIEGKEADARSDIFAFGAVLYEMVTGKRPFSGKSQISLASSILESDPQPASAIAPSTPAALEHIVTTCLQKNPEERFQTAHDIKLELQWIAADKSSPALAAALPLPSHSRERLGWGAGLVAAIILGAAIGILLYHPAQTAPAIRAAINPPANTTLALVGDFAGPPVLSPDGANVAFVATGSDGKNMIWVRPLDAPDAHMLAGTEAATFPFWSPDSRSVGFFAGSKLKTIDLNGGSALALCDAPFGRGGSWGPDGTILFAPEALSPILSVNATGGTPVPVTKFQAGQQPSHRWPFFLPDGKHFLYLFVNARDPGSDAVYYASLDGRENRRLVQSQSNALYANGFLLFIRGGQLMAQSFDPAKGTLSGELQNVAGGVMEDLSTWHIDASASGNGLLVFSNGGIGDQELVWVDRNGKQIGTVASKVADLVAARLSPQADRIALEIDKGAGAHDVWVLDIARGVQTRLTFGPVENDSPIWSPDGKWIVYTALTSNLHTKLYRKPSDGSGAEELLISDDQVTVPTDWSRDGKYLFYARGPSANYWEIWALPLQGERKPWLVVPHGTTTNSFATDGHLSPDGHWLAYTSGESGNPEVYVVAFGGGQGKWQVSTNGGYQPQWSHDGKELYYFNQATRSVFAVPVKEMNGGLQFGAPQQIASNSTSNQVGFYDVTPDGKKILLNLVSQQVSQSITVMTNFTSGLKK
jgi:Tol biopolymer transport system component